MTAEIFFNDKSEPLWLKIIMPVYVPTAPLYSKRNHTQKKETQKKETFT